MQSLIVIPARYQSKRFPGKPLAMILGKSMIERVWLQAKKSKAEKIIIATDHEKIFNHCQGFGANVMMTSTTHKTGSDRIGEVLEQHPCQSIINLQGDEPIIDPNIINQLIDLSKEHKLATVAVKNKSFEDVQDSNIVKVVIDNNYNALYFSRSPIPQANKENFQSFLSHWGIYAYQSELLKKFISWDASFLEKQERLEQLRTLSHGEKIHVLVAQKSLSIGIDIPSDIIKVEEVLKNR